MYWFCFGIFWHLIAIAQNQMDVRYAQVGYIMQIVGVYYLVKFTDFNTRITFNPLRLMIFTIICSFYIYFMFQPNWYYVEVGYGLHFSGNFRLMQVMFVYFYSFISFEWIYKIWRLSKSGVLLAAGITMNLIPITIYGLGSFILYLNPLAFIVNAVGILWIVSIFRRNPTLINILSFKTHKLMVLSRKSGMELYSHQWTGKMDGIDLMGSLMHAILTMSDSILFSGELNQLKLAKGVALFRHSQDYSIVLLANQESHYLNTCLDSFSNDFHEIFTQMVKNHEISTRGVHSSDFHFVSKLISKHFDGIKNYKK